ncbi:glutamate racemase [Eubacteriales bacterium OttesenSCG-928-M02]|nr:glutamate racemase [Eubacteriales bacterium OttesenSCG-928-M02]
MDNRPIGIFDSGLGGISVLSAIHSLMPQEHIIYLGDNGNAPYGPRSAEEIITLSLACVNQLMKQGVKAVVIACNTASSVATDIIREQVDIPIIAMEPAIRPAKGMVNGGKVLVLATEATLSLNRYRDRVMELAMDDQVINLPCPTFVTLVEEGMDDPMAWQAEIERVFSPIRHENIDVVVLGCTHFPHILPQLAPYLEDIFPGCQIIHGNDGTARQLLRVLERENLLAHREQIGNIVFQTSGDAQKYIPLMERLFQG